MDKIVNPKDLLNSMIRKGSNKEVEAEKRVNLKVLKDIMSKSKLNEAVDINKILAYIPELKNKGLHGEVEIYNQNIPDYKDFNDEYKTLKDIYKEVIGALCYAEGFIEKIKNDLHVEAFKADEIEKRHFKLQPDLLIEELQKFSKLLQEDLNIVMSFEKDLLIESLEGYYQNKKKLGIEKAKNELKKFKSVIDIIQIIKTFLEDVWNQIGVGDKINIINGELNLIISNIYIKIIYNLTPIRECIEKKLLEIEDDINILQVVKKG